MSLIPKEQVIHRFLDFVSKYVPLRVAKMATLGGLGLEAKIWNEREIQSSNGWLIERSRRKVQDLIQKYKFNIQTQLGTFSNTLAGHGEENAYIDGFHLDLCGTLNKPSLANFAPVVPLVLHGKGRCLAITVADQRESPFTTEWPKVMKRGMKLFGERYAPLYEKILEQQQLLPVKKAEELPAFMDGKRFDPAKATKREFGMLVELTELLRKQNMQCQPVAIERYVYLSRIKSRRPFRMRTFMFHFGERKGEFKEQAFADAWVNSPLLFSNGQDFTLMSVDVAVTTVEEKPLESVVQTHPVQPLLKGDRMSYPNLKAFMERASGLAPADALNEYVAVLADAEKWQEVLRMANGHANAVVVSRPEVRSDAPPVQLAPEPPVENQGRNTRHKRKWNDLSKRDQVLWVLKTLELKALQPKNQLTNGAWKAHIKETFGTFNLPLGKSLRSAVAQACKSYRPAFIKRIERAAENDEDRQAMLDRLSRLPEKAE